MKKTQKKPKEKEKGAWDFRYTNDGISTETPDKASEQELDEAVQKFCLPCSWCNSHQFFQELRWPSSFICAICYADTGAKRAAKDEARLVASPRTREKYTQLTGLQCLEPVSPCDLSPFKEDLAGEPEPLANIDLLELEKLFVGPGEYIMVEKKKIKNPLARQ